MKREQALAILYEMAIVVGGEIRLRPLVTKTLQRLLFHTSFPCGMVLLHPEGRPAARGDALDLRLEVSIGDHELAAHDGSVLSVAASWLGGPEAAETAAPIEVLPCRKGYYRAFLRLPVGECGFIILLAPSMPRTDLPLTRVFQPALANFAKAILLCRGNEAYTESLLGGRRDAESALHDLSYRNERILESVGEGICGLDREGRATFVNPVAAAMLGYAPRELVGAPLHDLVHHTDAAGAAIPTGRCPISLTLTEGSQQGITEDFFRRKDGTTFPVELVSTPLWEGERVAGAVIVFRDVTARKALEQEKAKLHEQLLQSQKMEAVGQLAGGVAHDFNNILTAIMGFGSLLQDGIPADDPRRENVDQVLQAAERAAQLTRSLLTFSRKQAMNPRPESLNDVVRAVERFLRRVIGEDVQLETNFKTDDLRIHGDSGQLQQVLMNLATNARDAMPHGGRLIIQTEAVELEDRFIRTHGFGKPGRYALLSVTDTGTGMDRDTCRRVFEPFFTTKQAGRGTGLGLAIAYGVVKQHGGYITLYSEPGHGTTFRIFLPLLAAEQLPLQSAPPPYPHGGSETILLAEDEPTIRALLASTLHDFGYAVIEAQDGNDAVAKFRGHTGEPIALLVLDVIMPGRSGTEAYEEIRRLRPGIKVLYLTGYTADMVHGLVGGEQALLMKPIFPVELVRKVGEMLA